MERFKVYHIQPNSSYYRGFALVAAESVEKANQFISSFKERDKDNCFDSWGYSSVDKFDVIEGIYSENDGILKYDIFYCG